VIEFNILSGGAAIMPPVDFLADDPANWVPYSTDPANIAAGETLYRTRTARINVNFGSHIDVLSGGKPRESVPLKATCAGCHSPDGIDLKFFHIPLNGIVNEAMALGMNKSEGKQIADFIYSRSIPYEAGARPWNAPFQPGAGMDGGSFTRWVAGAGYSDVLEDDRQSLHDIGTNVHFNTSVSAREVRLFVPLPTWQQWLPRIFPLDLPWPGMETNRYYTIFFEIESVLAGKYGIEAARLFQPYESKWDQAGQYLPAPPPDKDSAEYALWAICSKAIQHWRVCQTFHLMFKHQMMDVGLELYGSLSDNRRWFGGSVFRLGPHMLGLPHSQDTYPTFHQDSMQWYQAQLVLNSGNRDNHAIVPIDFGYLKSLCVSSFNNPLNYPLYGISMLNLVKAGEVTVNGNPPAKKNAGWSPFYCGANEIVNPTQPKWTQWLPEDLRRTTGEVLLRAWLDQSEKYSKDQYETAGYLGGGSLTNAVNYAAEELGKLGGDEAVIARLRAFSDKVD